MSTTDPHLLASGDAVFLTFTDTSGKEPPTSQSYSVTVTNPTTFTVNASQTSAGTYTQSNGIITASISGHGLAVGDPLYLHIVSGGATGGEFTVVDVVDANHFTVTNGDMVAHSGNCLLPKLSIGGYTQVGSNVTIKHDGTARS